MKYCVLVSLTHFWGLPSVFSNGWIWAVLLLCVFRILCFKTQRNGQCSNAIYNQIHGCGRRVSSSCSFDHLSSSQMRQHGVIGSASTDAQSNNCLYPYPYPQLHHIWCFLVETCNYLPSLKLLDSLLLEKTAYLYEEKIQYLFMNFIEIRFSETNNLLNDVVFGLIVTIISCYISRNIHLRSSSTISYNLTHWLTGRI